MFSSRYSLLLFALIILSNLTEVCAQSSATTGMIVGTVKDAQEATIVGAKITIKQLESNFERTLELKEDGLFQFVHLSPGQYQLTAQAKGFSSVIQNITLNIGTIPVTKFTLPIGNLEEVIEVNTNILIEANKTEKSSIIGQGFISSLPINRRNFLDFAITSANVIQDRSPVQGAEANSMLNFSGQNARQNNVTIDGLDNNDQNSGSVRATYSQEAIKEFQVVTNNFSAEFGRASGGVINIVTKSGTNIYQSSLFLFNRNDKISARNAFSITKPPFSQYQFGATLGGAIKKDTLHFFNAFERLSISDAINVSIDSKTIESINRLGFNDRSGDISYSEGLSSFLTRFDLKLNPQNQFSLRYNYAGIYNGILEPFGALRPQSIGGVGRIRDDNLSLSHNYISSSFGLVNDLRVLIARRDFQAEPNDLLGPKIAFVTDQGSVTSGRAFLLPSPREERIFQIANGTSLTSSRNQIKFGVDYLRVNVPEGTSSTPSIAAGGVTFSPLNFSSLLGNPAFPNFTSLETLDPVLRSAQQQVFLSFLSGILPQRVPGFPLIDLTKASLPINFAQGFGNPATTTNYSYFSAYIQDDISLKSNIIVKVGLRYDLERIKFAPKNSGNISPRIAVSYRPNDKLSIFGAYGIFYGITPFAPLSVAASMQKNNYKILILPFPFSILPFSLPGHKFPESETLPSNVDFVPQLSLISQIQPDLRNGYTQQINIGFNYLINHNSLFSASYQHVRGLKQLVQRDINPVVRPIVNDPIKSRITGRIDPTKGTVFEIGSIGDSYYNALNLELNYRLEPNLTIRAIYTFSKTIDNFVDYRPEFRTVQDPLNIRGERSYSNQDVRNRFVISGVWSQGDKKNILLRDFQLSTIITLESGRPYNLITGVDLDMNADPNPGDRPLRMSRNLGILPGFISTNARLTRSFKFRDTNKIEVFAEAFNLFNNVSISTESVVAQIFPPNPDGSFNLPEQKNGRYIFPKNLQQAAFAPRRLQFGFRFSF